MAQLKDTVVSGNLRVTDTILTDSLKVNGGTSSQFLKADGSLDSNSYATTSDLSAKQDALVSGTNIKTINGTSILGSGNISISGTGGGEANVIETVKVNGTALTPDSNKAVDVTVPTKVSDLTDDVVSGSYLPLTGGNMNSGALIRLRNSSFSMVLQPFGIVKESNEQSHALYLPDKSGTIALTSDLPTKVSDLTNDSGFTTNTGTITGITMNGASKGTSGVVDLGTVLTSFTETDPIFSASAASGITASDITNWNNVATGPQGYISEYNGVTGIMNSNGSFCALPEMGDGTEDYLLATVSQIPTESTVSGWGFTKNTDTYSKPSGGIPATDLAIAVQTSLGKADTALQSYTETDPVFLASAAHGISSSDITNWNNKQKAITISSSEPTSSQGSNGDIWIVI